MDLTQNSTELLVRNGVNEKSDVNEKGKYGYNALMSLCDFSTSENIDQVAGLLIDKGTNLSDTDEDGRNARSVLCGDSKNSKILLVAKSLILKGIAIYQKDKNGKSG